MSRNSVALHELLYLYCFYPYIYIALSTIEDNPFISADLPKLSCQIKLSFGDNALGNNTASPVTTTDAFYEHPC